MAFIEFSEAAPQSLAGPQVARPIPAPAPVAVAPAAAAARPHEFSALEWRVIELARGDGLDTLRPQRKRSWLARLILGPTPPSPMLADERLEALRRLAVHAWHHGYTLPASAMKQAFAVGYSESQVGSVIDTIAGYRPAFRRLSA
ncbi:hypothetical protein [Novosphingobium album (ex Liu et al. 2023)]|uniref:Helix-turn-helix domain-containing protein n=1 Tax=Novosphingobium album (ex Liu et al. 2023) TaxID=3031130 RepID=A0ABT5WQQ4_9SPHN|nr:hypothetical protein [Novosphingobium album (ex Liu et al. 2023)]MDE8652354.1 hypothetical protein [Novosphingobium album (ex Liu et al. 2023)]